MQNVYAQARIESTYLTRF